MSISLASDAGIWQVLQYYIAAKQVSFLIEVCEAAVSLRNFPDDPGSVAVISGICVFCQ